MPSIPTSSYPSTDDVTAACREVFQQSPQPMWLFDSCTMRVLEVNQAALAEYGLAREAFFSQSVPELLGVASFDPKADHQVNVAHRRPDWSVVICEVRIRLLPGKTPAVGLCTLVDVAKRSELEQRLRQVNEQAVLAGLREQSIRNELERANRAKDEFLALVSHELRTPLQSMTGWIELLQRGKLSPADSAHALDVIERNTKLQAQIVSDLLDVSRAIRGKLQLNPTRLDLRAVAKASVDELSMQAKNVGVRLDVELPPSGVMVEGDEGRLRQILANLLGNALKFTPRGGRVCLALEKDLTAAHIRVADSGEGIEHKFLSALFQPFSQEDTATTRVHGGLGLGLMIVRHLVEAHGGQIHAESGGKGLGATFIVDLILSTGESPPGKKMTESVSDSPALNGVRMLLVDDHADSREVLLAMFEHHGAEVCDAGSGDEALALLESEDVDIVVSDLAMPIMSGYQLLERLRASAGPARDVPVIALSAYASVEERQRALTAGFKAYAAKPIEPQQLLGVVARALGRAA